jgi:hypothetical protein
MSKQVSIAPALENRFSSGYDGDEEERVEQPTRMYAVLASFEVPIECGHV